jgi:hypothetical protein
MDRKLAIIKNVIKNNNILMQRIFYSSQSQTQEYSFPENELYHYTKTLYRKNYMKYNNQSIVKVDHDHVYTAQERLPNLQERLKGILLSTYY